MTRSPGAAIAGGSLANGVWSPQQAVGRGRFLPRQGNVHAPPKRTRVDGAAGPLIYTQSDGVKSHRKESLNAVLPGGRCRRSKSPARQGT
jgi:hypothetical protein